MAKFGPYEIPTNLGEGGMGRAHFTMGYVEGVSLAELIRPTASSFSPTDVVV